MKCKVCQKRFVPKKEMVYQITEPTSLANALIGGAKTFDVIECPRCGCQNVLCERLKKVKERKDDCDEIESCT